MARPMPDPAPVTAAMRPCRDPPSSFVLRVDPYAEGEGCLVPYERHTSLHVCFLPPAGPLRSTHYVCHDAARG